jgi:hypothetical protein
LKSLLQNWLLPFATNIKDELGVALDLSAIRYNNHKQNK